MMSVQSFPLDHILTRDVLHDLLTASPVGVFVIDLDGSCLYANPVCCRLFDIPAEQVAGALLLEMIAAEDRERVQQDFRQAIAAGQEYQGDFRLLHDGDVPVWVYAQLHDWRDEDSALRGYVGAVIDISVKKQAEEALARAVRVKDEFLANMSHELRTPLTAILGMSDVLLLDDEQGLTADQCEMVTTIQECGNHLLSLINDILDLAKIEAHCFELEPVLLDVEEICQASLRLLNDMARRKKITVMLSLDADVVFVRADARRLKQMLVNLLSNAVKFTPDGGQIGLEVRGNAVSELLHFTVWDTGIGIAVADQPRLFQAFTQLHTSSTRGYGGTGLGLSLVHRMAILHGGHVSLESTPGVGSRFTISLPWSVEDRLGAPKAEMPAATPARGAVAVTPLLLLAEDDPVCIEVLGRFFAKRHYQVICARSGVEALECVRATRPDVIIMDVCLPEMDGLETTARLRAMPEYAGIPIIALTAQAMVGDRERCLAAGMNAYFTKPANLEELARTIEEFCKTERESVP